MYVLMVTFYKTVNPSLIPATGVGLYESSYRFEMFPAAVSSEIEPLRKEAKNIRERFSGTYLSHQIFEVEEVS